MRNIIIVLILVFGLVGQLYSREVPMPGKKKQESEFPLKGVAAGCLPAASYTELNVNNVRARINSGGDMWWDLAGVAQYEIPKGSKKTSMFAGALWIGGVDVNGQLKLAAQRYRQVGYDFFTGPLTIDGTASITPDECIKWDKLFIIYRKDVDQFLAWRQNPSLYPDYKVPSYFYNYPAHGDPAKGQSFYLAPFYDANGDGVYNPDDGDYPYYDIDNSLCHKNLPTLETVAGQVKGGILADQVLKGDMTIWWVFNDKGNVHTETKGQSIGLEIRAQAFGFSTNDEINNMTFYSFEIINRSTYTLYNTYMSLWTDPDLGYSHDDYVGCDVLRGLGYSYNGDNFDEDGNGAFGYGSQPPAIGVDFFQGPYMDPDGMDNPAFRKYVDSTGAVVVENCNEAINGVNFGNGIVDDERFGMRRFVYHNNTGTVPWYMTDPDIAPEYYNFLRGIWKDGTKMLYGGNAHTSSGAYGPACDFMFPDETDPCDWGTGGVPPNGPRKWTEQTAGNQPYDRRFMQSAGPFTLKPGALNYITVGIPWARALSGGPFASVELLRKVDDKCQRLFDNCFKVIDGPDAPDVTIQELDREIILMLTNTQKTESYKEGDPSIVSPAGMHYDSIYRFEGYQIFQVLDPSVSAADVHNTEKARLVAQCDIKNGVSRLINYYYSEDLNAVVPVEEVNGSDQGIVHSFRILEDQFATKDKRLVNYKKYYFMVIAYAYNEYEKYSQDPAFQIPGVASLNGQQKPYLPGRKNIRVYTAIPHDPRPESYGTEVNASYGDSPEITRLEGKGNGGLDLEMTEESRLEVLQNGVCVTPTYEAGKGPINVKIVDPLNVVGANYVVRFDTNEKIDTCHWYLDMFNDQGVLLATYRSDQGISTPFEQLFPNLGISITIAQTTLPGDQSHETNGFITADIVYSDPNDRWLSGLPDVDGNSPLNWIRSGTLTNTNDPTYNDYTDGSQFIDPGQYYEKILNGTWAPYRLTSHEKYNPGIPSFKNTLTLNKMSNLYSVDIVFTPDKSKWSRCPVIETCDDPTLSEGNAAKGGIRKHPSVDKDGRTGTAEATFDGYETGMGWFPGYAINVETGERLNVMFGENSWYAGDNGRDMILNPTTTVEALSQYIFGGMHYVYIFGHNGNSSNDVPAYDGGKFIYEKLSAGGNANIRNVFKDAMWVGIPMPAFNSKWLNSEVRVRIRVNRPYQQNYAVNGIANPKNKNYPMYSFSTYKYAPVKNSVETAKSVLDKINVVPNPYYARSDYEINQVDNRVKIINLPTKCTVSIYTVNGILIRQFTKDDPDITYIDWDLKNEAGIPISGGLYLIHVQAPGVGERTIKWFGSLRPLDLNNF